MRIKNIIVSFVLIISLLGSPTKVIAKPLEIENLPKIKVYAFEQVLNRWGSEQWDSYDKLVKRESSWNSNAKNPKSSAYGLGQFLNSTWKIVECEKTNDPYKQIDCMLDYIEDRYKTPQQALKFHYLKNYY